jgi:hypothetical protein
MLKGIKKDAKLTKPSVRIRHSNLGVGNMNVFKWLVFGIVFFFQMTSSAFALNKLDRDRHIVEVTKEFSPTFQACSASLSSLKVYGLVCGRATTTAKQFMTTWSTNINLLSKITVKAKVETDWKTDADGYSSAGFITADNDRYHIFIGQPSTQVYFFVDWSQPSSDGDTNVFSSLPNTNTSLDTITNPPSTTVNSTIPHNSSNTRNIPKITENLAQKLAFGYGLSFNSVFSPDGRNYLTLSGPSDQDKYLRVWDASSGTLIKTILAGTKATGTGIAYSWDGSAVFTVLDEQPIRIWDAKTWRLLGELPSPEKGYVSGFAVHPKSPELIIIVGSGTYQLNANTGKTKFKISGNNSDVAYSPDGTLLAIGAYAPSPTRILRTDSLQEVITIPAVAGNSYTEVAWNPTGNQISVNTYTKTASTIGVYDLRGQKVFEFNSPVELSGAARWSPDGKVIAVAATYDTASDINERIFFLNPSTGQLVAQAFVDGYGSLEVVFSPDGTMIGDSLFIIRTTEGVTTSVNRIMGQQANATSTKASQLAKIEPLCESGQLTFAECTLARQSIESQNFSNIPVLLRFLNDEISLEEFLRLLRA